MEKIDYRYGGNTCDYTEHIHEQPTSFSVPALRLRVVVPTEYLLVV
jgi:hypothetical protein